MELDDVAAELYALPPGAFTAARNQRAKQARAEDQALLAKQIARLPKPSAATWALNMLARRRVDEISQVLDLGAELRDAQEDLDPARMRELSQQRSRLLSAVVRDGRALASDLGVKISEPAASEMEQTLRAAMTDPRASEALRSGLLVRTFTSNGLEPVDLTGAVAVPGAWPEQPAAAEGDGSASIVVPTRARRPGSESKAHADDTGVDKLAVRDEARRHERQAAEAELAEAQRSLDDAEAELADAEREATEAAERRARLAAELESLRNRAAELEVEAASAEREAGAAERARRLASRLAEQGRRAVARGRERLGRLS
ncbi:hypothetical protein RBS60_15070 [Sinomonas sp. ASV486]|uniref:hypothetical protein n=1 Tax=Sinomonas sp. ASV486 TaxID=3051170 RepID=UPI0027DE21B5|nr:hypothetical protein [Sinomonas sp. ASV486]MDQ4491521.1 hypothetical protein [Sinomonas sp. ASV486]